jgi:hypothetical protein
MKASRFHGRLWLGVIGALNVMPITALATTDDGVLTVGAAPEEPLCYYGYLGNFGSYSPTGLTGGETVAWLADIYFGSSCSSGVVTDFKVTGFSSNPGQSWLTSVTCGGVTKTSSTSGYSYSSGAAIWSWSSSPFGFISKVGEQLSCEVVVN